MRHVYSQKSPAKDTLLDCDQETALLTNVIVLAQRWQALLQSQTHMSIDTHKHRLVDVGPTQTSDEGGLLRQFTLLVLGYNCYGWCRLC